MNIGKFLLVALAGAVFFFMYFPIAVIVLFSFSSGKIPAFPIDGFTLHWYEELFREPKLWVAARNSLLVSVPSVLVSTVFGTMAAFLFQRHAFPGRGLLQMAILMPYVLPGILTGISLTLLFKLLNVSASLLTVIVGHVVLITPLVMVMTINRLKRLDRSIELASMDLGASPAATFFRVTLPNIKGAIIGGMLLGLTVSFDEVIVTFFLIGTDNTLPMQIWSMIRYGFSPQINAMYSMIIVVTLFVVFMMNRSSPENKGGNRK
ncbi:ABC transporter permease [Paenibacillus flagellatus]|uniref:ABC transporter permease n=1 Tax=Paenibacillus flagellatus TaxID=2211139 RepID=A0A2V5K0U4_9BACL|nr:ABC transporter permease [Paenibacillus flagellatus]PYI51294.1 ABC transporter permease [Paenibacillus flagellatus]